jgi:hypothetical protein
MGNAPQSANGTAGRPLKNNPLKSVGLTWAMAYRGTIRVMVAHPLLALDPMAKLVKSLLRERPPWHNFLSRGREGGGSLFGDIEWIQLIAHDRLTRALALHRERVGVRFSRRGDFMRGRKGIWGGHVARGIK